MNRWKIVTALSAALACGVACTSQPETEDVASKSSAVVSAKLVTPASEPSPATLTLDWLIDPGVTDRSPDAPLTLVLTNHTADSMSGHVTLQLRGLGAKRSVDLGTKTLAAGSSAALTWVPSSSPIQPLRTSAELTAMVAYSRGPVTANQPTTNISLAFSTDYAHAFVSGDDDASVRLASMGRRGAGAAFAAIGSGDRAALLAELGSRRGKLDGVTVDQAPQIAATNAAARSTPDNAVSDSIAYEGAIADAPAGVSKVQPDLNFCYIVNLITSPICADYQISSFTDLNVASSNAPLEDHNLVGSPVAYANAMVLSNGSTIWQGRLDANGCTPSIRYCRYQTQVNVSTASLQAPTVSVFGITYYGRDFEITPQETYTSSMRYGSNASTGAPLAWADLYDVTGAADYPLRAAAVADRILTMPDNGVLTGFGTPPPALHIHTEQGCPSNPYSGGLYSGGFGEACTTDGNTVYFGPALSYSDPNNPTPTGHHTTEEAFTIAHELGHAMQFASNGGPSPIAGDYDDIGSGLCSCDYVAVGNRTHCMESRLNERASEVEGFAHFYAARVMNDQDSVSTGARFTYYKEFNLVTYGGAYGDGVLLQHPPVPINAGSPFTDRTTTGWVRYECPSSGHASEYDFMTFLWNVNGNATTSSRGSVGDLYTILGSPTVVSNFTWTSLNNAATSHFGAGSAKQFTFANAGNLNGVNL